MSRHEVALGNTAPVLTGSLYVADNRVVVSTIGLPGAAKTVQDLKTLLGASVIKSIDVPARRLQTSPDGTQLFDDA